MTWTITLFKEHPKEWRLHMTAVWEQKIYLWGESYSPNQRVTNSLW